MQIELKHLTATNCLLNNSPETFRQIENLIILRERIIEASRLTPKPVTINSAYRSPNVNRAVGGAANSHHLFLNDAAAVDMTAGSAIENRAWYMRIKALMPYSQLILEKGGRWIHLGYSDIRATAHEQKAWETPA